MRYYVKDVHGGPAYYVEAADRDEVLDGLGAPTPDPVYGRWEVAPAPSEDMPFLEALEALLAKYGARIVDEGCGCCGSAGIRTTDGQYTLDLTPEWDALRASGLAYKETVSKTPATSPTSTPPPPVSR